MGNCHGTAQDLNTFVFVVCLVNHGEVKEVAIYKNGLAREAENLSAEQDLNLEK